MSLLAPALACKVGQIAMIRAHDKNHSPARATGAYWKGNLTPMFYVAGIGLALVNVQMAQALCMAVALIWLAPDRRIWRVVA